MSRDPTGVFGPLAEDYAASRPGYPAALAEALDARRPAAPDRVVDLATGTGAAAATLLDGGLRVVGVEPSRPMLARAAARLAGRPGWLGGVAGRAEAIPLADGVAGAVVVAQAFHWLDPGPALDEIARVLVPDGVLAVAWYRIRDTPVTRAALELLERHGSAGGRPVTERMWETPEPLARHPAFEVEGRIDLDHGRETDADRYVRFARSWSYGGGALGPAAWEAFERDLRSRIAEIAGDRPWVEKVALAVHFARRRERR